MIEHKHISKIIIIITAVAVALCFLAIGYAGELNETLGGTGVSMEYETKLFDTDEIIDIDIQMDEDTWNEMLANASAEEYYSCDVVINGQRVNNVAIRPKGNTSLSSIAMDPDTDRFSLKLEFDHFVDGQTCFGLDKLILNNNYADATNMKEAIIYDMFQSVDADASLSNYAKISVNGEYWGVYLALEGVEQSFMLRNFGTQDGELYKPESMGMGGGARSSKSASSSSSSGGQGGPGGFSMGGGGANLNYSDDDLDSYSTIWDGQITDTSKADHRRVVTALENISEGTDLEKYLDVDNILKYMAVHTFAVNLDSLSGNMSHNYYLYEYDGKLNIFPWDYNLALGGFSMGNSGGASGVINDAIDTPFSGTKFFDALLSNEEYLARYHAYLQQLVDEYVNGGAFDETYNRIRSQIDELVETDPTAFYSNDEYETAADMLYDVIKLRAESIKGQLDGTIPSTDAGQKEDSSSLIDGSGIDIEAMGQFNMGGDTGTDFGGFLGKGKRRPGSTGDQTQESTAGSQTQEGTTGGQTQGNTSMPDMPEGFSPGSMPEMGDFDPNNMPDMSNFDSENMPDMSNFDPNNMPDMGSFDPNNMPDMSNFDSENMPDMGNFSPDSRPDMGSFSAGASNSSSQVTKNLITLGICLAIAVGALIFVKLWRRKK